MASKISIIIPTYNEQEKIGLLLRHIRGNALGADYETIVADGGSIDATEDAVKGTNALFLKCPVKGRAAQMNYAARFCQGDVFFFLHADSLPPEKFLFHIQSAVEAGSDAGCFRLKFDSQHWFLRANAWFTRFDVNAVRFGDQGLFVTRNLFFKSGGFREDHIVMEDQEMVVRLKKLGARFAVLPDYVTTSARKYLDNGPIRLQYIFFLIWLNYYRGKPQSELVQLYRRKIKNSKINAQDVQRSLSPVDGFRQKSPERKSENTAR